MLSTNDLGTITDAIGPAANGILLESLSTILGAVVLALLGLWKRSAAKSRMQSSVAEVLIRALKKTSEQLEGGEDTGFVAKTVHEEAKSKGIEQHVEKAIDKVETKMAQEENGNDSAKL